MLAPVTRPAEQEYTTNLSCFLLFFFETWLTQLLKNRFTPCQLIENTLFYQSTCMGVGSVINERDWPCVNHLFGSAFGCCLCPCYVLTGLDCEGFDWIPCGPCPLVSFRPFRLRFHRLGSWWRFCDAVSSSSDRQPPTANRRPPCRICGLTCGSTCCPLILRYFGVSVD